MKAEPDVPYVEGVWLPNESIAASRFAALLKATFTNSASIHWSKALTVDLLHSNGHRSKGHVSGFDKDGLFIRW